MGKLRLGLGLGLVAVAAVTIATVLVITDLLPWGDNGRIENSRKFIQKGELIDGICRYDSWLMIAPGEPPKILRVLKENPDTCERFVEQGTLSKKGQRAMEEKDRKAEGTRATVVPRQSENGGRLPEKLQQTMEEEDLRRAREMGITVVPQQSK